MYTKDKATRITLRLNEKQFEFVKLSSDCLGVSPSEFLRMVINSTMATSTAAAASVIVKGAEGYIENLCEEVFGRENDETDINNIV